jgi:hypothetical protein
MKNIKASSLALLFLLLVCIVATAHEGGKHFLGTVEAFDQNTLTVATTSNGTVTFAITKTTKFVQSGEPAHVSDLKKGGRVVVHARLNGQLWEAQEVRFGPSDRK